MSEASNTDEDLNDLYQDIMMTHARVPQGVKPLANFDGIGVEKNRFCGDETTIYVKLNEGHLHFAQKTKGCSICQASASILYGFVEGKTQEQVETLIAMAIAACTEGVIPDNPDLSEIAAFSGLKKFPSRIKCGTTPWRALEKALLDIKEKA